MTSAFESLCEILVKDYELPAERLTPETPLEEVDLDSLAAMEILFSLEDRYQISVEETNPTPFATLGELAAYIDSLVAARDAS